MTIHKRFFLISLVIVFLSLILSKHALAQETSASSAGDLFGKALSINNQGIVLIMGSTLQNGPLHPILWKDAVLKDLYASIEGVLDIKQTNSLNDMNEFVGTVIDDTSNIKGVYYDAKGVINYLVPSGSLQDAQSVEAVAINNRSQILGTYRKTDGSTHMYIWENGSYRPIDSPELAGLDRVYDINDNGFVTGTIVKDSVRRAFMIDTASGSNSIVEIKYSGGDVLGYDNIEPRSINNLNEVVGSAQYGGLMGSARAFHWSNGVFSGLGTLPGGSISTAYAINNKGEIVGESSVSNGEIHAFHYSSGIMTDLGLLTHDSGQYVSFGSTSLAINDSGTIVGTNSSYEVSDPMSLVQHPIIFGVQPVSETDGICKKLPKKIKKDKDLPPPFDGYCPQ